MCCVSEQISPLESRNSVFLSCAKPAVLVCVYTHEERGTHQKSDAEALLPATLPLTTACERTLWPA